MRVPVLDKFPRNPTLVFIAALFVLQQLAGTDIWFSILTSLFVGLWASAFSISGGLNYTSGAFIFFFGLLTVVLGLTAKALLFEPGDRNLLSPDLTMLVYCATMGGILAAAFVNRGLRAKVPLLDTITSLDAMHKASIVCLVVGWIIQLLAGSEYTSTGSLSSALRQLNRLPLMAILLATTYEIRKSGGKRSINWVGGTGIGLLVGFGLLYFTKGGMLVGPTCWLIAAILNGYDFSKLQLIVSTALFAFFLYYLVPYSQYVRLFSTSSRTENVAIALHYLGSLEETRRMYNDIESRSEIGDEPHLFDERIGFLDRATILAADDALINYTGKGHEFGLLPTYVAYANVIPHVIWRDKPTMGAGNRYAYELGIVSEEDTTTGISFSAAADAFHQASWLAILFLVPVHMFLAFFVTDSLAGSARYSVWPMIWILDASHAASEGGLAVTISMFTGGVVSLLFTIGLIRYVAPFVTNVFTGRKIASTVQNSAGQPQFVTASAAPGGGDPLK